MSVESRVEPTTDTPPGQAGSSHADSSAAESVRTFLRLLERGDIDSWMELWAEDGEQFYPFGTEMFPPHLVGKQAIFERWKDMPGMFEVLSFPIRELWVDGDTVLARFDSQSVLKAGQAEYLNTYLGIFKFDSMGKLAQYWEYFDPIIAGVNFGLATVQYSSPDAENPDAENPDAGNPDGSSTNGGATAGITPKVVVRTSPDAPAAGLRATIEVTINLA